MPREGPASGDDCWGADSGGSVDGTAQLSGEFWAMDGQPSGPLPRDPGESGHNWSIRESERYRPAALLGRGGMGEVWSAQDARLARTVAIKRASSGAAAGLRLQLEAEVCARLEHPNIVPIYDAGLDQEGAPWYAMRLVRGRTLQQWLEEATTLQARLDLARPMLAVCQAVGYAHLHGVIHRDLKPANVMIGAHGEVQVLDWGLARRVADPLKNPGEDSGIVGLPPPAGQLPEVDQGMTIAGAVIGTPRYMSPEAARGEAVGPQGDVWSLGVMLHQLATGQLPRAGLTAQQQLASLRHGAGVPAALAKSADIPIELLAIVAKALSPNPDDRYRDAADLAEDLARWLDGKRIRAHSYTPRQLLTRLARAWKVPLAVAAVALLLLAGLAAFSVQRIARQRDRAQAAEATTGQALSRADAALTQALQGSAALAAGDLAYPEAEVLLTAAPNASADPLLRGLLAGLNPATGLPTRIALPVPACALGAVGYGGDVVFCAQPRQLQAIAAASGAVQWTKPLEGATQLRAADGKVAVLLHAAGKRRALVLDAATGAELASAEIDAPMQLHSGRQLLVAANQGWLVALPNSGVAVTSRLHPCHSDHRLLAVAVGREDDALAGLCEGAVMLAEPGTLEWQPVAIAGWPATPLSITAAALQRRDGLLVVGTTRGQLAAIDLGRRRWLREITTAGGMIRDLQWAPAAAEVLAQPERGGAMLWAPTTLAQPVRLPWTHSQIHGFTANGQVITVAETAHQWQLRPERSRVMDLVGSVGLTSADSRGELVAGSAGDGSLVVVDAANGQERLRIKAMAGVAKRVSFSADGQWLAVSSMAKPYLRIFDTATWQAADDAGLQMMIRRAEFAKGAWMVTAPVAKGGPMVLRILPGGLAGPALQLSDMGFSDAAVAYGGERAVWLSEIGGVVVEGVIGDVPQVQETLRVPGAVAVDVSSDGELLAVAASDELVLRRGRSQPLVHLGKVRCRLMDVALDASADWVAAPCSQGQIYVWNTRTLALRAELHGHTGHAVHVAFENGTGDLLSAGWDGTVRRWRGQTLRAPELPPAELAQQRWQLSLPEALARPR